MKSLTRDLLASLETLQILSQRRTRMARRGEISSVKKGSSLEFSDYREYLQGDDIRSIDWNVYARTEKLFLKLFFEDESRPLYFVVDGSISMRFGDPSKFEYALALSAALSYMSLKRYDRPRILVLEDQGYSEYRFTSLPQFFALTRRLEKLEPRGETHLNAALRKIALARLPRGVYFLITDFYSADGFDGVGLLAASGNELHCVHTLTQEEIQPAHRGDLRLIDSETDGTAEVSISPQILRRYMARLDALKQAAAKTAERARASYYFVSTDTPLDALILHDLRRIGIVS